MLHESYMYDQISDEILQSSRFHSSLAEVPKHVRGGGIIHDGNSYSISTVGIYEYLAEAVSGNTVKYKPPFFSRFTPFFMEGFS